MRHYSVNALLQRLVYNLSREERHVCACVKGYRPPNSRTTVGMPRVYVRRSKKRHVARTVRAWCGQPLQPNLWTYKKIWGICSFHRKKTHVVYTSVAWWWILPICSPSSRKGNMSTDPNMTCGIETDRQRESTRQSIPAGSILCGPRISLLVLHRQSKTRCSLHTRIWHDISWYIMSYHDISLYRPWDKTVIDLVLMWHEHVVTTCR